MTKTTRWILLVLGLIILAAILLVLRLDPTTGGSAEPDPLEVPATSFAPSPEPVSVPTAGRRVAGLAASPTLPTPPVEEPPVAT